MLLRDMAARHARVCRRHSPAAFTAHTTQFMLLPRGKVGKIAAPVVLYAQMKRSENGSKDALHVQAEELPHSLVFYVHCIVENEPLTVISADNADVYQQEAKAVVDNDIYAVAGKCGLCFVTALR